LETAIGEPEAALKACFASVPAELDPMPLAVGFGTTEAELSSASAEPDAFGAVAEAVVLSRDAQ
jgi:hypothetical protein